MVLSHHPPLAADGRSVAKPSSTSRWSGVGLGLVFLCFASPMVLADQTVLATSDQVHIEGRYAVEQDGVTIGFPGVRLTCRINGKQLTLRTAGTSDTVMLDVVVDGQLRDTWTLDENFADKQIRFDTGGPRSIEIHKRTEGWQGLWKVSELSTDGEFLPPPKPLTRKLLFIGDSITAGSGTDATLDDTTDDYTTSNGRLTYARRLGDRLNAQVHLIAYGGRGLVRDWQDIRETNNAPQYFHWTLPDDSNRLWDHSRYVPDAVSIALGTNDFNPGVPEANEWIAALIRFIGDIRRAYPKVPIFLISSPMHGDGYGPGETLVRYLQAAADSTPDVTVIDVAHRPGRPVDSHPISSEHEGMADEIEPVFRRVLGW